jgi:HlyD family secretion protein
LENEDRVMRLRSASAALIAIICGLSVSLGVGPGPKIAHWTTVAQAQSALRNLIDRLRGTTLPAGIAKTNGRIEATQVDVSSKYPGRLTQVTVNEGDEVTAGQVVGRIASPEYEAQLRGAQAQALRAREALAEVTALVAQRGSDVNFARTDYERARQLVTNGHVSQQEADRRHNRFEQADASFRSALAQHDQAQHTIETADAEVQRIEAILVDLTLIAPRSGRVQYVIARNGEVVAAGARVLTILDLQDVYLTIFLPASDAGRLGVGEDARIILDPVPQYVVPATVSFVASEAQFTPKSVETQEEREKLMFRVKLQIDQQVLQQYYRKVKTGVRGLGFVRTDPNVAWPADLQIKLPQ